MNDVKASIQELEHARRSHLVRVEYDSYKISLNAILTRSQKIVSDYEQLLLDEDFRTTFIATVDIFGNIRSHRKELKQLYKSAKTFERKGDHDQAIISYNNAINEAKILQDYIDEIENNCTFKVALLSVKKKDDRFKKVERNALRNVVVAGVILLVVNLGVVFLGRHLDSKQSSGAIGSTQSAGSTGSGKTP